MPERTRTPLGQIMLTNLILTVISQDKPGIVEAVANVVTSNGGNWLESRLTQLAGKFAGVVRIQVEKDKQQGLVEALQALGARQINVLVDEADDTFAPASTQLASFHAVGPDRPGIVREISQAFAHYNINVEELSTRYSSMPYSGDPLFEAEGKLQVPEHFALHELEERLDEVANHLAVDISVKMLN